MSTFMRSFLKQNCSNSFSIYQKQPKILEFVFDRSLYIRHRPQWVQISMFKTNTAKKKYFIFPLYEYVCQVSLKKRHGSRRLHRCYYNQLTALLCESEAWINTRKITVSSARFCQTSRQEQLGRERKLVFYWQWPSSIRLLIREERRSRFVSRDASTATVSQVCQGAAHSVGVLFPS